MRFKKEKNKCHIEKHAKIRRHIEKPANEGIPILKSDGPSSPCKTAKILKNFRQKA